MSHVPSAIGNIASQPLTHFLFNGGVWWSLKYSASGIGIPVSFRILSRESCVFRAGFNPKGSEVKFQAIPVEMCT